MLTENNEELIIREFDDEDERVSEPRKEQIPHEEEDFDLGMEEDEEGSLGSEESSEDIFFARLWRREVIRSADTILGALYRKSRRWFDAVTLVYCMGKPQKDVAACMGMSLDSFQSMLYRAKNWIKKHYREEYDHIYRT